MAYQLTQDCIDMDVEMSASAHSVLVVLCRHANDAGECFPATALIAKKAHLKALGFRQLRPPGKGVVS